jgi:hypothetical protein
MIAIAEPITIEGRIVATPFGEPFSVTVKPEDRERRSAFRILRALEIANDLSDLLTIRDSAPPHVQLQAFEVLEDFHIFQLVKQLHRQGTYQFRGSTHPTVPAIVLRNQVATGKGPLVLNKNGGGCPYNTFFWGSLFMLTTNWYQEGKLWNVQSYPAAQWPPTNEEMQKFGTTDFRPTLVWVRSGRLFLAL